MILLDVVAALSWDPGFKGILTVAVAVAILCGSVWLIMATNTGARLGFLLALTGLMGWWFVMGIIWASYGIGYKGPAPSWEVVDTVQGDPSGAQLEKAQSLPLPDELPDPVERRDGSEELLEAFPTDQRDPGRSDLVTVDTEFAEELNEKVAPWKVLPTTNGYTGETQSVVTEAVGPDGLGLFADATEYAVIDSYITGGKKGRTDDSIIGRVKYKVTSALTFRNDPLYAAVQIQAVIPQETKPGQAPPTPLVDEDAPVYTVVLQRDRGALRLPAIAFTLFCGVSFAILANMLHRRDKLADEQRAAVAGAT